MKSVTCLPRADVYALTEILRPPDTLQTHLNTIGATLAAHACDPDGNVIVAIAVDNAKSKMTRRSKAHSCGACSIRIHGVDIHACYIGHKLTHTQQRNLGEWIANTVCTTRQTVVIGDMNVNTQPLFTSIIAPRLYSKKLKEHVRDRPTFFRGASFTSIDRCYANCLNSFDLSRNHEVSDHAVMRMKVLARDSLKVPEVNRYWEMKSPSTAFKADSIQTLDQLQQAMHNDAGRLTKLHAHKERQKATLPHEKAIANNRIRQLRHELAFKSHDWAMKRAMRPKQNRFEPPSAIPPETWIKYAREKFCCDTRIGRSSNEHHIPIYGQHVESALNNLKGTSSTADYSALFLRKLSATCINDIAGRFQTWANEGIPPSITESTLLMIRKRDDDAKSPQSYRPIAVCRLTGKLLHFAVYEALKAQAIPLILQHDFQRAFARGNHTPRLCARAQSHLDQSKENAVLIADLKSAFDSVKHTTLVKYVTSYLGQQWATVVRNILDAQEFRIALEEGYTPTMAMTRGLAQGNPLACILFALLTMEPPRDLQTSAELFADDLQVLILISAIEPTLTSIENWAMERDLEWNVAKTTVVSKIETIFSFQQTRIATKRAHKYLGSHLHADTLDVPCSFHEARTALAEIQCAKIACMRSLPTVIKARLYKTYVLPMFSHHAFSKCCNSADEKMKRARLRLLPKHEKKPFLDFGAWRYGHGIPYFHNYIHSQRARMLPYVDYNPKIHKWMMPPNCKVRKLQPYVAPEMQELCGLLCEASFSSHLVKCASDASFDASTSTGSVGFCVKVNSVFRTLGYKLVENVASSLAGEQIGALLLQHAITETNLPPDRFRPHCDNLAVCTQGTQHKCADNPRSLAREKPGLQNSAAITWKRGHAGNDLIDGADRAAQTAIRTIDSSDLFAPNRHVKNTLTLSVVQGHGASAKRGIMLHQSEEASRFFNHVTQMGYDMLDKRAASLVPLHILHSRTLRQKLLCIHGAHDLFLAYASHVILPEQTSVSRELKVKCPTCSRTTLSAKHVLFARDKRHTRALRNLFPGAPRPPSRTQFWLTLISDPLQAMAHAARIALLYEPRDRTAAMWAKFILYGESH